MRCPYYRKVSLENHPYGLKGYCEGDVHGMLRVPTLFEETHYCITAQFPRCRVFQSRQVRVDRKHARMSEESDVEG